MLRRLGIPAAVVLIIAGIIFAVPPDKLLEAVNLAGLLDFNETSTDAPEGPSLNLPGATDTEVTATSGIPAGLVPLVELSSLNIAASLLAGVEGGLVGDFTLNFDGTADGGAGSDVTLTATDDPLADAATGAAGVVTSIGSSNTLSIGSVGTAGLGVFGQLLGGGASTGGGRGGREDEAAGEPEIVKLVVDDPEEATVTAVPEAGSLTLIVGGLGLLLARGLYRRRG